MTKTLKELNKLVDKENTSGGDLWLNSLTSIPEGFSPTVGWSLHLDGLTPKDRAKALKQTRKLSDGDCVPYKYIFADGILTHIKREKKVGKYTLYVGEIPNNNVVTDGQRFAHCRNFRDGIEDLAFKAAKERGAGQYKSIDVSKPIPLSEAVQMYRVITGACRAGTQAFMSSLEGLKDAYTVAEMIDITKWQYGSTVFADFFAKEVS